MRTHNTKRSDRADGECRKGAAHAILEAHRACIIRDARRQLLLRLLDGRVATIDDVRPYVDLPEGVNPKVFGAVPGPLSRSGIIRAAGLVKTKRRVAHARPVMVWHLRDASAAIQWLRTHPPLPPLTTATQLPLPFGSSENKTGDAANVARSATC